MIATKTVLMVFFDLCKAINTVNNMIMLNKLHNDGMRGQRTYYKITEESRVDILCAIT